MKKQIVNLKECLQFVTKDTSKIREILAPRNSVIRRQSLAEAVVPVGASTDEHYHKSSEEIYFIQQGRGEIRIDGVTSSVKEGDGIAIPPGSVHKIWNLGDQDLVFLCICVPPYEHDDTEITEK